LIFTLAAAEIERLRAKGTNLQGRRAVAAMMPVDGVGA
jgi:hypothetical protein